MYYIIVLIFTALVQTREILRQIVVIFKHCIAHTNIGTRAQHIDQHQRLMALALAFRQRAREKPWLKIVHDRVKPLRHLFPFVCITIFPKAAGAAISRPKFCNPSGIKTKMNLAHLYCWQIGPLGQCKLKISAFLKKLPTFERNQFVHIFIGKINTKLEFQVY